MIFVRFTLTKLLESPMCPSILTRPKGRQFYAWVKRLEAVHDVEQLSIPEWIQLYGVWKERIRNRPIEGEVA